ncbi:MAG: D-aminopeptidase [Lentisphaerae bacterium ADurb.Bin242]|nr:MAG: D-aminopeptidase [Lentisphaerae bacterium ADurb.Bin242]
MKIYIFADMEGISGISHENYTEPGAVHYARGQQFLTDDVNACVRGCFRAGATEVLIQDGHWSGYNILWEKLDPRAELLQGGIQGMRYPGLEGSRALILLGYHAKAGTAAAFLDHTYSPRGIQNKWLNGMEVGEFALDAAVAAEYGVPVIMTSGDDKLCREAAEWLPEVVTCQVKKAYAVNTVCMLSAEQAHALIEAKTIEAIDRIGKIPLRKADTPVVVRTQGAQRNYAPVNLPNYKMIDARTWEVTAATVEEALWKM